MVLDGAFDGAFDWSKTGEIDSLLKKNGDVEMTVTKLGRLKNFVESNG